MTSPPRALGDILEYACLISRDAKRISGELDHHIRNDTDPHKCGSMHRLRQLLIDFNIGMEHVEQRLRGLAIIK